jgi:hypothetical protein
MNKSASFTPVHGINICHNHFNTCILWLRAFVKNVTG